MRRWLSFFLLLALMVGLWPVTAIKAAPPERVVQSIGATMTNVAPNAFDFTAGEVTFDLTFTMNFTSPDLEFVDYFEVTLPDGWTINTVYPATKTGCTSQPTTQGVKNGQTVYWQHADYFPGDGSTCGPWGGESTFVVNVTASTCPGDTFTFPWFAEGDWWGSAPHTASGVSPAVSCVAQICRNVTLLTENFDALTPPALPPDWAVVQVSGTTASWVTKAGTRYPSGYPAYSAPNLIYFNSWSASSGQQARLYYTLPLDFSRLQSPQLAFQMFHDLGYSSSNDRVQVQVSLDGGATWENVGAPISRYDGSGPAWKQHTVDLSGYAGQSSVMVGFLGISAWGNDIHLDDISLTGRICGGGVYFQPKAAVKNACMGSTAVHALALVNDSETDYTFDLSYSGNAWTVNGPTTVTVPAGESVPVEVAVEVPTYVMDGAQDYLLVEGVAQEDANVTVKAELTTVAGNAWVEAPKGGQPALFAAAASADGALYYFDGRDETGLATQRTQIFIPNVGWREGAPNPFGAFYGGVAGTYEGKIYYAPGFANGMQGSKDFAVYDPATDSWEVLAPRPVKAGLAVGGVTSDGKFVLVGGSPNAGFLSTTQVYLYDIATNTWSTGATLNAVGFTGAGAVMVEDKLYVAGNYFGSQAFYVYDVAANTWTSLGDLPQGLVAPLLLSDGASIYVIGGGITGSQPSAAVRLYDLPAGTWADFMPFPEPLLGAAGGALEGEMYVFGGGASVARAFESAPHYKNVAYCGYELVELSGTVTNGVTGEPVAGAMIEAEGIGPFIAGLFPTPMTFTDEDGNYSLALNPAVYRVTASSKGVDAKVAEVEVGPGGATHDFVLGPAALNLDNAGPLEVTLPWGETQDITLTLTNAGYSMLNYEFTETNGGGPVLREHRVELRLDGTTPTLQRYTPPTRSKTVSLGKASTAPGAVYRPVTAKSHKLLADAVELVVDDGGAEDSVGLTAGGQIIWLNRFTPAPEEFPFTLNEVWVLFGSDWGSGGVNPGELFDVYIFQDTDGDGDPGTGAELVASFLDIEVQAANGEDWTVVELADPVVLYGPGDVLIAIVNRTAGTDAGEYPASIDMTASQQRSWVGYYGGPAPQPPDLPAPALWGLIDDFDLAGNWTVRGYGVKGIAGGDIPWLYTTPVSGTVAPVDEEVNTAEAVLTFDAYAVTALGTYTGTLFLNSNDPALPVIEIPVQLNVVANENAGELEGTVTSDRPGGPLPDSVAFLEASDGFTQTLTTDENGYYHTYIYPDHLGVFTITVSNEAGYLADIQTMTLTAGLTQHDVMLYFNGPEMVVTLETIEASVIWGESAEAPVEVANIGKQPLNYATNFMLLAYFEDFEASDGGYTVTGDNPSWEWGKPTSGPGAAWSGEKVWATNLSGPYNDDEVSCIVSPPIDLSAYQGYDLLLDWYEYGNVETYFDDWYTEISADGGATWELINGPWTGSTGMWMPAPLMDSPYYLGPAYAVPDFRIRFCLESDFSVTKDGYYVDDVRIWAPIFWGGLSQDFGEVAVDDTETLTLTMDSTLLDRPGTYLGNVIVSGDDPFNSQVSIPVTFEVQDNPLQGYISGQVLGNRSLGGDNGPLEGAQVHLYNPSISGADFVAMTGADGTFDLYIRPDFLNGSLYFMEVTKPGYLPYVEVFPFYQGSQLYRDVTIRLAASLLTVNPESIDETLAWGGNKAVTLKVSNPNPATLPLSAELIEVGSVFEPLYPTTVSINLPAVIQKTTPTGSGAVLDSPTRGAMAGRTQEVRLNALALGKLKVLIFSVDAAEDPAYVAWLYNALTAYPDVEVDVMEATPSVTVEELAPYNVVIFGSRYSSASMDPTILGNTFADYVDQGGKVIMIQNAFYNGTSDGIWWKLGGRFEEEYAPVEYGGFDRYVGPEMLEVYNASHPIMAGWDPEVNYVVDNFRSYSDLVVRPGAEVVAYWDTGNYYIVANRYAVVFNQVLTYDPNWEGDVPMLLHNALVYLAAGDAPWLSVADTQFNLPIGTSKTTQVTLDASVVNQPGTYRTWLWFINNDPLQQGAYVPAAMTVEPDATMMNVGGRITSNRTGEPIKGALVALTPSAGGEPIMTFKTDDEGRFTLWLTQDKAGSYELSATKDGYLPYSETLTLTPGARLLRNVVLTLDAAWINATAEELSVRLGFTLEATRTVTIENWGERDLEFRFSELPAEVPPPSTEGLAPVTVDTAPLKVDPAVLTDLKDGTASFWVRLRQSANLSRVPSYLDRVTRASYVYNSLKAVAENSQGNVIAYAKSRGLQYKPYWIVNSVLIEGATAADLEAFKAMPEVAEIKGRFNAQLHADGLVANFGLVNSVELIERAAQAGPQWSGTAWGLIFTGADKVWSEFGVTGAGVTVANIDTGVQWDHPALINQYRGWNGGTAEHNYNWYAPTNDAKNACPGAASAPCDWDGHGSHTMGTMVGDDGVDHHTGMAPGAKWIACMGCDTPPNSCSDAALTACAQWMLAPTDLNGNNPDPSKAPDIINNSWGGGGGDFWYQEYVDAWVAAGMFPAFSAGNSGPGCRTTGSPGDYAVSFASGAVDESGMIADFSSRGPGQADANLKPDIAAPGVAVCSTVPDNSYTCGYSGTSMASPHTAGAVALIWSAAPTLKGDIATTRDLLTQNANPNVPDEGNCGKPAGTPGIVPNYTYGYGYLDALAAVRAAMYYLDVPWLTVTPVTGTVPVLGTLTVEVGFNGADLEPGVYTATLVLGHNDPIQKPFVLPVEMIITEIRHVYLPMTLRQW